jgi:hypothetical protein
MYELAAAESGNIPQKLRTDRMRKSADEINDAIQFADVSRAALGSNV